MMPHSTYRNTPGRRTKALLACSLALLASGLAQATSQTTNASEAELLADELRALRQDYEKRIQALEARIRKLEAPAPAPAAPMSSTVDASGAALAPGAGIAGPRPFLRSTESREKALEHDERALGKRIEQVLQGYVDLTGYFRAGYGRNDQGGPQVGFQAPGASSKYRLGNEAEAYGEFTFGKTFFTPGLFSLEGGHPAGDQAGPVARVQATINVFNPYQDHLNSGATDFGLPELWASIGQVSTAQPGMKFWAGNRFYRRHDIHISDFFFSNMSGGGGGVEDVGTPFGKLALAWIGSGSTSGVSSVPEPDPTNKAGFSKGNLDLRLYEVAVPLGKAEFGVVFARANSGRDANGNQADRSEGLGLLAVHVREGVFSKDGVNKFSLQYGTGAAKTLNSGFETYTTQGGTFIRPDERDSWRFRVTEHFTANLGNSFSIGPAILYQITEYKQHGGQVQWASAGVRPVWHLTDRVSLAGEAGIDWVKDGAAGTSDSLYKLTLAPQVSLGGRFMSRPAVRAFLTYAAWGDEFRGAVGGLDYVNETQALTYGLQMEAWW